MNPPSSSKKRRAQISKELRDLLGEDVPHHFLDAQTIRLLSEGERVNTTNARIIADKVIELARNGDRWAIDFLADRTEGKAAQAIKADDGDRILTEQLNDVTVQHLNKLAGINAHASVGANPLAQPATVGGDRDEDAAGERAAGPTSPLLDLPEDGFDGPENA